MDRQEKQLKIRFSVRRASGPEKKEIVQVPKLGKKQANVEYNVTPSISPLSSPQQAHVYYIINHL